MKTIEFRSSNGTLVVDLEGNVLPEKSHRQSGIEDIVKVNLKELKEFLSSIGEDIKDSNSYDILNVGYWNEDGSYVDPAWDWRKSFRMTHKILVTSEEDVYIECPHCEHWEAQPLHQQRHHLQTFKITEWYPDNDKGNELSRMQCIPCKEEFTSEWDYDNIEEEETV